MTAENAAVPGNVNLSKQTAIRFVILLGIVSLFADMTYEGARSIAGPFLAVLGASGLVVGVVAGLGELIGYTLRLVSGYFSDRTQRYWTVTLIGYAVNLIAVPLLALAGSWELAAMLMILERMGKAIRTPARDAMLSYATEQTGRGWGFGLHEAMDQIGAILGPLIVAAVLALRGTYQSAFALLLVPALLALTTLIIARVLYPNPRDLEINTPKLQTEGFPRVFWIYLIAVGLVGAGYVDFPLISFHFQQAQIAPDAWIPILYAIAMGTDAIAALVFGRLFDRVGIGILIVVTLMSAFFAPLVFLDGFGLAVVGMMLWGIGLGAQESILRAAVAGMTAAERRGSAYGIFNTGFGIMWFLGSALMGYLYDVSLPALIALSVLLQLAAVPLFIVVKRSTVKQ